MAQGNLKRANEIIVAMKQAQADARKTLPDASSIPNGLRPGGLEVYNPTGKVSDVGTVPVTWSGVSSLAESRSGASDASTATVTIKQDQQNAYLYWNKFNLGQQTTVNFNLADNLKANPGQSIAFNKVMSASDPSHIFGNINAQGQVYILNQNGILFHNGSTVNTRSLVASTLPINENLAGSVTKAGKGIANNPDYQFLFSALPVPGGKNGPTDPFTPTLSSATIGNVIVEKGATITSAADNNNTGGLVALIGPNVRNEGEINTPNGQTILAAGLQVGLTPHSSADPSLRGLDVYVGKVEDRSITILDVAAGTTAQAGGIALNGGLISSPLGSATMAGRTVSQNGVIDSVTSVSLNGRIDLIASYGATANPDYKSDGTQGPPIIFGQNGLVETRSQSVIQILPDWSSTETVVGMSLALNSLVSVQAANVHLGQDSLMIAPGAIATKGAYSQNSLVLNSGVTIDAGSWFDSGSFGGLHQNQFLHDTGQIYVDKGAIIDVSGSTDVQVSSSQNFLTLQLRGAELANSPLQRTSAIRGKDITVDSRITGSYDGQFWVGTPLGDATGYLNLIQRTVGQLTVSGGSVSLGAGDSLVMRDGAMVNVSGGWVQYSGGTFNTTKLLSSTGQIVDISKATPDQIYTGIVKSPGSFYEAPYLIGGDGGSISILTPSIALDGSIKGITVAGERQVRPLSGGVSVMPVSSSLTLNFRSDLVDGNQLYDASPYHPDVVFLKKSQVSTHDFSLGTSLEQDRKSKVYLSPALASEDGFGQINIVNHDGSISVPAGTSLELGANGSFDATANTIQVSGGIVAPGGAISLSGESVSFDLQKALAKIVVQTQPVVDVLQDKVTGENVLQYGPIGNDGALTVLRRDGSIQTLSASLFTAATGGVVSVTTGALISTAGYLVDDLFGTPGSIPLVTKGGSISLNSLNTRIAEKAVLDVSGGASLSRLAKVSYGDGGKLSISGGSDPEIRDIHSGHLSLLGSLHGYAGMNPGGSISSTPGTLSIAAPYVVVGGNAAGRGLSLPSIFFNMGGFSRFSITGTGSGLPGDQDYQAAVTIATGAEVSPVVERYRIFTSGNRVVTKYYNPSGNAGSAASIALNAAGLYDSGLPSGKKLLVQGDLIQQAGSSITIGPRLTVSSGAAVSSTGSVTLSGMTIEVMGNISVPGGAIVMKASSALPSNGDDYTPFVTLDLAGASLNVAGESVYIPDPSGIRPFFGSILAGGEISLSGNILARSDSTMNASGGTGLLSDAGGIGSMYRKDTSGGSIVFSGGETFYTSAKLTAASGGIGGTAGMLTVSSGQFLPSGVTAPPDYEIRPSLVVSQAPVSLPYGDPSSASVPMVARSLPASDPLGVAGGGHLSIDALVGSGFSSINLQGNVFFHNDVSIDVPGSLYVASGGILKADGTVNLSASRIVIGQPFAAPLAAEDSRRNQIFGNNNQPLYAPPTWGGGALFLSGTSLIDVGNLSLNGIGNAVLSTAAGGSVRGDGNLVMAGDLVLNSGKVFPSTGVRFSMTAFSHDSVTGKAVADVVVATSTVTPSQSSQLHLASVLGLGAGQAISGDGIPEETTILSVDVPGKTITLSAPVAQLMPASSQIEAGYGSISLNQTGLAGQTPLSAAGSLDLNAASISQGGSLLAPSGSIAMGSSGGSSNDRDPLSGLPAPDALYIKLKLGSLTSVGAAGMTIPYGTSTDGTSWIDPSGTTITTIGLPSKSVSINGLNEDLAKGAVVNLEGGGDLYALRWVSGLGGTLNLLGQSDHTWNASVPYSAGDLVSYGGSSWQARQSSTGVSPSIGLQWTKLPSTYSIIPGYDEKYAPQGYGDGSLGVGSQVRLSGNELLAAGSYTLLPAIYAALPGAYLLKVSLASRNTLLPIDFRSPDETVLVSGAFQNGMNPSQPLENSALFVLSAPKTVSDFVEYKNLSASSFFGTTANAGNLQFSAISGLKIGGMVTGNGAPGGKGSFVGMSVTGTMSVGAGGSAQLDPALLNTWDYGDLLIGGSYSESSSGAYTVTPRALSLSIGANTELLGNSVLLVAQRDVIVQPGALIEAKDRTASKLQSLVLADGNLLFVSANPSIAESRTALNQNAGSGVVLMNGTQLKGASIICDSAGSSSIDPTASIQAASIGIAAGSFALVLDPILEPQSVTSGFEVPGTLVLSGGIIDQLAKSSVLNITSGSTLDFYGSTSGINGGTFGSDSMLFLGLHAGEIRGFDLGGGSASWTAKTIVLDNPKRAIPSGSKTASSDGSLEFNAATIKLGNNALAVDQFSYVSLNASGIISGTSSGTLSVGSSLIPTSLFMTTPMIVASAGNSLGVTASGDLVLQSPDAGYATAASIVPGAGASLSFTGAMLTVDTALSAPSGSIALRATAGDLIVGGGGVASIDVLGVTKTTPAGVTTGDAGIISLQSDAGNVNLASGASLNLSASGSSSAGSLIIAAPAGILTIDRNAVLNAAGGSSGGANGSFALDVSSLEPTGEGISLLSSITPHISPDQNGNGGFNKSLSFRIRTGDVNVDTYIKASSFSLIADQGSVDVTPDGVVDASGVSGGTISLQASGSVILEPNSYLGVHAAAYDRTGKGGSVFLSAGAETGGQINPNAVLDLQTGSAIDLGVTATPTSIQDVGGVLHLRAPITQDGSDIQIAHLDTTISGSSSVQIEGYRLYDLTPNGGGGADISSIFPQAIADARSFFGSAGQSVNPAASAIDRLKVNQDSSVAALINIAPGLEIINRGGELVLTQDLDLSTWRFGANSTPGFLTLRAANNITLNASLSDGFQARDSAGNSLASGADYRAILLALNTSLPVNFQSWSYQITAGSDFFSAAPSVTSLQSANINLGKSLIGYNVSAIDLSGSKAITQDVIQASGGYYQVIRTGTGDIAISASGNIRLWNQFSSIYTAGVIAGDQTLVDPGNSQPTFDIPKPDFTGQELVAGLGKPQQGTPYTPQYSFSGGNISIHAGNDIAHLTYDAGNNIIDDSVREMPNNWLYRRAAVGSDGKYLQLPTSGAPLETQSTTWWVDFSNFFEGVGALGGGNISIQAGHDIKNLDAVIPTNFRASGHDSSGNSLVASAIMRSIELGGGNIFIKTGNNLDAGVYYVESGSIEVHAGGSVITNPTRDPVISSTISSTVVASDPVSYLPTTFFLGKGSISVNASSDVLLGPIANVFLMPQGVNNGYFYKTYFSTYSPDDAVLIKSIGGSITLRQDVITASYSEPTPLLQTWMDSFSYDSKSINSQNISYWQPWTRLAESSSSLANLDTISTKGSANYKLSPSSLKIEAMNGGLQIQGNYIASPSAMGNITINVHDDINGLNPIGLRQFTIKGQTEYLMLWSSSTINLSDTTPFALPTVFNPLSVASALVQSGANLNPSNYSKGVSLMNNLENMLNESGSFSGEYGVLQKKLSMHDSSLLHREDANPLIVSSLNGDISGLTLYSPKQSIIFAGRDITDVGLYIQNINSSDITSISAGGDVVLFDPSSRSQVKSIAVAAGQYSVPLQSGDIQISGPGSLIVTAGGNIDLGNGPNNSDGTGVGITSIGNARNPALPFEGADIQLMAGVKSPGSLGTDKILSAAASSPDSLRYFKEVSESLSQTGDNGLLDAFATVRSWNELINSGVISVDIKDRIALALFNIILRDAGRDHNNSDSPAYGSYASGEQVIGNLFSTDYHGAGSVITWSRDLRTKNGGSITINAPGGGVTLANTTIGSTLAPPGIVTEHGGAINIFTKDNVDIGIGRIFTLQGGDIMIWSDKGNIAAGSSAKTVASAPPTRVLIDPQSGAVLTDLAGLATGGGIGVLATVKDAPVGNVDLIAPSGIIDAGDAGIRSSGNLNLAATKILNADNIAVGGISVGAPPASAPASAPPPAAPPAAAPPAAANTAAAANNSAAETASKNNAASQGDETPSIYSIEILGYGGGDEDDESKKAADASVAPIQASL
jgi:filamentous hemagglutinin family protein